MIEGELQPPIGHDHPFLEIQLLHLCPPKAGAGEDQGAPQGLGDVAGVYVAADYPRHHGPEGEEVVLGQDQNPDVLAVFDEIAQIPGCSVSSETTAQDEHLVLEFFVRWLLPGSVPGRRIQSSPESAQPDDQPADGEPALNQSVHVDLPRSISPGRDPSPSLPATYITERRAPTKQSAASRPLPGRSCFSGRRTPPGKHPASAPGPAPHP